MLCKLSQWRQTKRYVETALIVRNIFSIVLDVMEIRPSYGLCMEAENCLNVFAGTFLKTRRNLFSILQLSKNDIFRRLCAVFGGIYCLKRQLDGVIVNEDKCKAIISGRQRLALEHLVVGQGHLPPEIVASEGENQISRGIFITDRYFLHTISYSLKVIYAQYILLEVLSFASTDQLCKVKKKV